MDKNEEMVERILPNPRGMFREEEMGWDRCKEAVLKALQSGVICVVPSVSEIEKIISETLNWPMQTGDEEAAIKILEHLKKG